MRKFVTILAATIAALAISSTAHAATPTSEQFVRVVNHSTKVVVVEVDGTVEVYKHRANGTTKFTYNAPATVATDGAVCAAHSGTRIMRGGSTAPLGSFIDFNRSVTIFNTDGTVEVFNGPNQTPTSKCVDSGF